MKIRPLQDRVIVRRLEEAVEKTKGGIIIPDTAKEKPQHGKVIAVGKGKLNDDGKLTPLDVKVGDKILFGKYSGSEIKIDGEEHLIMREKIFRGVNILADAVTVTLGPRGRNVVLDKSFGAPTVTKDGVTVAKEVELEDKFENMGAQMVKEVASKTSDVAGDGTTTATVLARSIVKEGAKSVAAGMNPMDLKRGIDLAVEAVVE